MSESQGESTIACLPTDVLLEIFEFLDSTSLKLCALVCKQWDSIIGSSTTTMRKLPLVIKCNWEQKESEIKELVRKHHTIILDSVKIYDKKLLKALSKTGSHVRHFELDNVKVFHPSLKDIVRSMKQLEQLTISDSVIQINDEVLVLPTQEMAREMTNGQQLKSMVILKSDWRFFKLLCHLRVCELKVMSTKYDEANRECFETFVLHQTKLEALAIYVQHGDIYRSLARFAQVNYPFKLKKLCVDFEHWGNDSSVDDCFIAFLKSHQSTLEDLETRRNLSDEIAEFVMKHMKVKRFMTSYCTNMSSSHRFYNAIRPNQHLKSLILTGELNKLQVARGLVHIFPRLEKFVIKSWSAEVINEVFLLCANNLKHLNYLEVPSFTVDTPELPNPMLKTFKVDFVDDVLQWQTFCVNNPSIEHLSVKWLTNRNTFTYEVLNDVTSRLVNLKRITFGAYFNPTMRILDVMSRNCPQLARLEVFSENSHQRRTSFRTNIGRLKVIFFPPEATNSIFKEEQTMWDDVEKFHDLESDSDDEMSDDDDHLDLAEDDGHNDEAMFWERDDNAFGEPGDEYVYFGQGPEMFLFG